MKALRDYLKRHSITQQQFAERLGVKQPTVSEWVNGGYLPNTPMLLRISQETGIAVDKLLAEIKAA